MPYVDTKFVWDEFRRIMLTDDEVEALCIRKSMEYLPNQAVAGEKIAARLTTFIRRRVATSLVRVGNSEGNALGLTNGSSAHPSKACDFNQEFFDQNGIRLAEPEAFDVARAVRKALATADIIGFRFADLLGPPESRLISNLIARGALTPALGVLYAREFLQDGLRSGEFSRATVTSAWIYLGLLPYLQQIMDAAIAVIVITGRPELRGEFEKRLGGRLQFIAVPPRGFRPEDDWESHYRGHYPSVIGFLRKEDLKGTLVLVGAGLLGKIYCHAAKDSGGVAVDLGSGFDLLAGLSTRPVHAKVRLDDYRWLRQK